MAARFNKSSMFIGPEHCSPQPGVPSVALLLEASRNLEAVINRLLRYESEEMEEPAENVFDVAFNQRGRSV